MFQVGLGAAIATLLLAAPAAAQLTGTAHDFSGAAWSGGDICQPCHTPHNPTLPQLIPLWNHTTTVSVFTPYVSVGGDLDSTPGVPAGVSLACMSCHDGATNLDAYGGSAGDPANRIIGTANLGTDLSTTHPISFAYDTALSGVDGELFDPATDPSGLGGTIAQDLLFGVADDQLECASCHDPHGSGLPTLLRITMTGSVLCVTCHDKL